MACQHRRIKSVNCILYCMDCGAMIDPPEGVNVFEKPKEPAKAPEKPKRRARKGATTK